MQPEDVHPALVAAYNAGDFEALLAVYTPDAVFVVKPGRVTQGPDELRAVLQKLVAAGGTLAVEPRSYTRSGDVVLVLGTFRVRGKRRDGTPVDSSGRFADVLRRQPDGGWRIEIDNGFAGE